MRKELHWKLSPFSELAVNELYDILHLRIKVFSIEQDCVYMDMDYKDQKASHLLGYLDNTLVAYSRLFKSGDYFDTASIGRVIVAEEYRKYGYGHELVQKSIKGVISCFNENAITISAQEHLKNFYGKHGFIQISESYLEDGIPHIKMLKDS